MIQLKYTSPHRFLHAGLVFLLRDSDTVILGCHCPFLSSSDGSKMFSSILAAVLSELFKKWLYMSVVVLVRACPARPATVTSGTPAAICIVILVCRSECTVRCGSPAASQTLISILWIFKCAEKSTSLWQSAFNLNSYYSEISFSSLSVSSTS